MNKPARNISTTKSLYRNFIFLYHIGFLFCSNFLFAQAPAITSFFPSGGAVGTQVSITGTNFSTTPSLNSVYFGAAKATVTSATELELIATVPPGATFAPLSVTIGGLTAYSKKPFVVSFPGNQVIDVNSFAAKVDITPGQYPYNVAVGDLDADGKPDIAVTNELTNVVSVYRNVSTTGLFSFETKIDFTTGTTPHGLAIADLNGDGKLDLIVACGSVLSILQNTHTSGSFTSGSFQAKVDLSAGGESVAVSDLDKDGKPDLAVVAGTNFSIVKNKHITGSIASGSFDAKVDFAIGGYSLGIAVSDLDADGKDDVVVVNGAEVGSASVFKNTHSTGSFSATSFAAKTDFTVGNYPTGVAIGDLDDDDKPDLVVFNPGSNSVSVLRNTHTTGSFTASSFQSKVDFSTGPYPNSVSIGDLNGDGRPDIAIPNESGNTVSVIRNAHTSGVFSSGSFMPKVDFAVGVAPYHVAIGDIDGDKKPDLVTANNNISGTCSILRNLLGAPTITLVSPEAGNTGTPVTITGTFFSSVPGDNTVYFGATKAAVMSASATQLVVSVPAGAGYHPITVTVNGATAYSGKPFNVTFPSSRELNVYSFEAGKSYTTGAQPKDVAVGDLDGDGKADLVTVNEAMLSGTVSILRNVHATGPFNTNSFEAKTDLLVGGCPKSIAIADLDGDGKLDLAITNPCGNKISVLRNIHVSGPFASTSFETMQDFPTGQAPQGISIRDLDLDGRPDLVIANVDGGTISILRNVHPGGPFTTGSFAAKTDFVSGDFVGGSESNPVSIAVSDLDGDGKPDVAVANNGADLNTGHTSISVFRNTSTPGSITANSFAALVDFRTADIGYPSFSIAAGDLNNDGKSDLSVGNERLGVFTSNSVPGTIASGSFTRTDFDTDANIVGISDLDGDGYADLSMTGGTGASGDPALSLFKNTSNSGAVTLAARLDFIINDGENKHAIGDFDADGKPDLILVDEVAGTVSVLRNTVAASQPVGHPGTFSATNLSSGQITLSFSAASTIANAAGYIILRREDETYPTPSGIADQVSPVSLILPSGTTLVTTILNTAATTFEDNGLTADKSYHYAIIPFNIYGSDQATYNYKTDGTILTANANTLSTEPTSQASALTFSNISTSSLALNLTEGDGSSRIVIVKQGSVVDAFPVDGTSYTANNIFGNGSQLGVGNYVVNIGSGPVSISGLLSGTTYYFRVFEFNGSGGSENYNLSSATDNPLNRSTLVPEPASQATNIVFSNVTATSMSVAWTNSTGSERLLLAREGSALSGNPVDGMSYTGNPDFITAEDAVNGHKVLYRGAASSVNIAGLTPGTIYHFQVFELNGNGEQTNYLITSNTGNPSSKSTLAPEPVDQPTAIGFTVVTQNALTISFSAATGSPTGYIALRRSAAPSADLPADGVEYAYGQLLGSSTVAYVGVALTFEDVGLSPGTTYHYAVYSFNGTTGTYNYLTSSPLTGSQQTLQPAEFKINPPVHDAKFSNGGKISVEVLGARGPLTVAMQSRKISAADFASTPVNLKSGSSTVYEITITNEMADELGMEFSFQADDGIGTVENPSSYFLYRSIDASSNASIPFSSGFNGKTNTYQMFSIPYVTDDKTIAGIFNELGAYDKLLWRLFRYDGNSGRYVEYQAGLPNTIELGNGYWFNAKNNLAEPIQIGTGMVEQANQSDPSMLTLSAGWNQIGNPYPFNLDWSVVVGANDKVGTLWFFGNGSYSKSNVFKPWTGAFVHADEAMTLPIPVTAKTIASGRLSDHALEPDLDSEQWLLPITLRINDFQQISGVGMHPRASSSKDKFDEITVPRFIDYAEMNTHHQEFFSPHFSTDVVPTSEEQVWIFDVKSNLEDQQGELAWDHTSIAANNSSLLLIDLLDGNWVDMKTTGRYTFKHREGRQFKVLYNRVGEIKPGMTLLGEAYPNPFTSEVRIPLLVDEPGVKQIDIYDGFGRLIQRISADFQQAGIQEMTWDPREVKGQEIGSGMFYYRLIDHRAYKVKRLIKK